MTQAELFPQELTQAELAELNKRIYEICCECYPHEEFFEVEPTVFVEV